MGPRRASMGRLHNDMAIAAEVIGPVVAVSPVEALLPMGMPAVVEVIAPVRAPVEMPVAMPVMEVSKMAEAMCGTWRRPQRSSNRRNAEDLSKGDHVLLQFCPDRK